MARATDPEIYDSCLNCLQRFEEELRRRALPEGTKARWRTQLHSLLQYLTITERTTLNGAGAEQIAGWLEPAKGFAEFDERIDVLGALRAFSANPALAQNRQGGARSWRKTSELLFWRRHLRRLRARTQAYFESIRQEDILAAELRCAPFYRAYHTAHPAADGAGVFVESDEEVIAKVMAMAKGKKVESIVDMGCGSGRLLAKLGERFPGARLYGTSIFAFSEGETERLRALNIIPVYKAASDTGLPPGSQDVVVSTEVIEHLRHPEEMVREVARILKPGGVFCLTAPSLNAHIYGKNPFSYLAVALATRFSFVLPPFHQLYSPLTRIPLVHYAFDLSHLERICAPHFARVSTETSRFVALKKFRLDRWAPHLPIVRKMGGLCVVRGEK